MHVSCDKCHYDSGDFDSNEEIAAKVAEDGGKMAMARDVLGKPVGWTIVCPKCGDDGKDNDNMHLD